MSSLLGRILKNGLQRQATGFLSYGRESALWAFPLLATAGWILYPCLNYEWLIEIGMEPNPDAGIIAVHAAREARMAARAQAKGTVVDEEEEEEEEETEEEAPADDDESEEDVGANGAADVEEDSSEEEEEAEEEEDDAAEIVIKPLYTKSTEESLAAKWDNFSIKAVRMSEDDDDDDDEDEDDDGK